MSNKKQSAKKLAPLEVEADAFTTDAPRQGPVGEHKPPTEAELIAEAAEAAAKA